jgi:hypothetical protein
MTWPTDPARLQALARRYHAEADDLRDRTPFIEDEDLEGHLEYIDHLREMAAIAYSRIPKPAPPKQRTRVLILSDGSVIGQGEATSL